MHNKGKSLLFALLFIGCIILPLFTFQPVSAETVDYRGKVVYIGTSVTAGRGPDMIHDPIHSLAGGTESSKEKGWSGYWAEKKLNESYDILWNVTDWYRNQTYANSWDKYCFAVGGGTTNDEYVGGICSGSAGTPLQAVPYIFSGQWGKAVWRYRNMDWENDIDFVVLEGGYHDQYHGRTVAQMNSDTYAIYNITHSYNITLVLRSQLPGGNTSNHPYAGYSGLIPGWAKQLNDWRSSFAENHSDCIFVDTFHSVLVTHSDDGVHYWPNVSGGNIYYQESGTGATHPTVIGQSIIGNLTADAIYAYVEGLDDDESGSFTATITSINGQDNDTSLYTDQTYIVWLRDPNATSYSLQVSNSTDFASPFISLSNITINGGWCSNTYLNTSASGSPYAYNYYENSTHCTLYLPYSLNITYTGSHYYRYRSSGTR